jgi:hypothetical protein
MPIAPDVTIERVEYRVVPVAATLNRKIAPDSPLLFACLSVRWGVPDSLPALSHLEQELLSFSPSFGRHECRGPMAYHVFHSARGAREASPEPLDPCLALAHLIEHAVIDFECAILQQGRCSGVTGALRDVPGRYDLMVECPDFRIGRLCLRFAVAWVTAATTGVPLGTAEGDLLIAARRVHQDSWEKLTPPALASTLGWTETRAGRALARLRDAGYLDEHSFALNFSGIPAYRISAA